MATVNDLKAMSDAQIEARIAQLKAADQQAAQTAAPAAKVAASAARGGQIQVPQLNLAQYLQSNQQQMNNTNLVNLLTRLQGRGSLMGGQANLGINPMTGRPANYGDYTKAPIQRLFGGVDKPNLADKIAYLAGGKIFVPAGGSAPAQDPYTNVLFPDNGVTYTGLNQGGEGAFVGPMLPTYGPTLPEEPLAEDPVSLLEEPTMPTMPDWSMQDIYGFAGDPAWGI